MAAGLAVLPAAMTSCSEQKKQDEQKAVPVEVSRALERDVPIEVHAIGEIEAYSSVEVRPQVDGPILKVHFHEGQYVKEGDLLFTIDPRPLQVALRRAEAALAKDRAQYENAVVDAKRYEELVRKGYVAKADYDQYRTAAEALKATVEADVAAVDDARIKLGYCRINAPISGKTGGVALDQGNILRANDQAPLVTIYRTDPIYVSFTVPEQDLPAIKKHMAAGKLKVGVALDGAQSPNEYEGELGFIDNAVDRQTGTIRLKGLLKNRGMALWPGQFVNVSLRLSTQRGAVVVPSQSIKTGQNGQYIFVIKEDLTAESRPVTAGVAYQNETVVIKGIVPGETVVTDGAMQLVSGAKVEVKNAAPAEGGR